MQNRRDVVRKAAVGLASALGLSGALAQGSFANGPVKIVVPFAPGGNVDLIARFLAPRLAERFGQPVIVDNKPGAAGNLAAEMAVRAEPDGRTLLLTSANLIINSGLYKLSFDPLKDLAPVSQVVISHYVLVVNQTVPARTLPELIALARAKPGALSFATWGGGTGGHIALELFKQAAGVDILHVPYKGVAPAMQGLIGGETSMMIDVLGTALPQIKSGKVAPIAMTGRKRAEQLPALPLFSDTLPGFSIEGWQGFFVPAKTPAATVQRAQRELAAVLNSSDVKTRLVELGFDVVGSAPQQFAELLARESAQYARIIKSSNIKVD